MLSPGQQNFSEYAEYFLAAVVAALGVPPVSVAASPVIVEETIVLVEETNVDGSPVYTPVPTND